MFSDAVQNLGVTTAITHGSTVTYTRSTANGGGAAGLVAVIGQSSVGVENYNDGQSMTVNQVDFIFDAPISVGVMEGITLVYHEIEPKRGDKIAFNGDVYGVLPSVDKKCWRWSDNYHNKIRVHTKQVSE